MDLIIAIILLLTAFIGWSIGTNAASNNISMIAAPKITSLGYATLIASVLMLAGALFQSERVIATLSENIVPSQDLEGDNVIVLSVLFTTTALILLATAGTIPVSASHAIVGALVGSSLIAGLWGRMNTSLLCTIFLSWFLTPLASLSIAYLLSLLITRKLSKHIGLISYSQIFKILTLIATAFMAYGLGANTIGTAVSLVIGSGISTGKPIILLTSISMILGTVMLSKRVVTTISKKIILIDPVTAFTVQFTAGIVIYAFTIIGIPISTTQAMIGGLAGVGLTKGVGMMDERMLETIFVGWIITPVGAAGLSALVYCAITYGLSLGPFSF